MMKQIALFVLCCSVFLTSCFSKKKDVRIAQKAPNIIVIHVDDLGYHDLSTHGSEIYQTPHIDNLAKESFEFTNAYANYPRCVPSRFAMMTGKYPIQNGDVPDDGFEMTDVSADENFINQFNTAGYQTAYFGKWQLGHDTHSPKGFGYNYSFAAGAAGSPISFLYPFNTPKGHNRNVKKKPIVDIEELSKEGDYLTDNLTTEFISYLKNADKNKPVMAVLAYYAVHQPLEAKDADVKRNRKEISQFDFGEGLEYISEGTGRTKMRQDNATYAAMVENLDVNIGRIMTTLKQLGMDENTIVVFSSDHGGLSNDGYNKRGLATSNAPLRAGKGWLYEGGIKVPLFVRWKNHIQPQKETTSIAMLMDVFPTLLDYGTGKIVSTVDGKSLKPIIETKKSNKNRVVYWHSSKARPKNTGDAKSSAIREGNMKLIHFYETNTVELYDLSSDLSEEYNIATQQPEVADKLLKKLNQWKENF
ncbi:sulfatase [Flavicella marina]|uniref:sulfatase n=1 Tax=Flavicella marina TaxID=1475951 RepID=UPI00126591EA|nr:sulfatase [Flavicella marina]